MRPITIIGTIAVSELGGPVRPSAFGPSQPSAPRIQIIDMRRPTSVSTRSEIVRMKTTIRAIISRNASPIRGNIPSSVAFLYSSSITTDEILLTCNGPSSSDARSRILRSASSIRSSPVSRKRMMAIATGVPSVSVPVIASIASRISGGPRAESMSDCVTDSKPSTWRRSLSSNEGATTGSVGASKSPTLGSLTTSRTRASICVSPSGVSASPRKRSVTTLASPASPKRSSSSTKASATAFPWGRVAFVSGGGARRVVPAPSATVMMTRMRRVTYGRAVTSRLSLSSIVLMACYSS